MLTQFYRRLVAFGRERSGNVAITFALATLPLVGTVGAAVDYTHANKVKTALQGALDSAALMLSRDAASLSSTDLNTKASNYVQAMLNQPEAKNIVVTASYTTAGGTKIVVNGAASVATVFLGVIGLNSVTVSGSATAAWGTTRLRVALVLDNTGSMADAGKMTALKSATKDLLTQLQGAASTNGDVYVSIVPFAKDVNIGATNYNASYIDWTDWNAANKTCNGTLWYGTCYGSWVTANHNTWNGCVTDRGPSSSPGTSTWDQVVTQPGTTAASKWPAEQYDACPAAMMGLTYNWTALSNLVDQMQPNGSTNQPIGLVWGWQSLVGGGPLTAPAKDSNYNYSDIIILMSDGLNTQDRWYGNGSSISTSVDGRMYLSTTGAGTCANIKSSGVTIYTIQVNTSGDPTSTLLQNCAGSKDKMIDPAKFFVVTSASGIGTVFKQIGTGLTQLRVAK
ncbi:MAG: pilus assembly protein [Proteobacteria bacterium]|nr:pilus assembly protein [Pseudomonadota bacterium]